MKQLFAGLCALALLTLISPLTAQAQAKGAETRKAEPYYDVAKEITLTARVSSVLKRPSAGMIAGSHLLLATGYASVDASLGRWGLQGKGALPAYVGEQVEVTGVMKTLKNKEVFVVRSVKVGSSVYAIRNQRGIMVSPQSRERASIKSAQKGESL
jgi:hypothetical protein